MNTTHSYTIETEQHGLQAHFLMEKGSVSVNEFWLEILDSDGKVVSAWDNFDYIKKLYNDLRKRKKKSSRIETLKEDIDHLKITKRDVRKFLKESFKLLITLNDQKTARLH